MSVVLNSYVTDTLMKDDEGTCIRVESDDDTTSRYINFLLRSLQVESHLPLIATHLYKYGDVFVRLYKNSEVNAFYNSFKFNKKPLTEDIKVHKTLKEDKFSHNIEVMTDPSVIFELTKFGDTCGFIKPREEMEVNESGQVMNYNFTNQDIEVFEPDRFVHGIYIERDGRARECVNLDTSAENKTITSYDVLMGKSMFADVFSVWKKYSLLKDTLVLSRITRSAILRIINVETGDMAEEESQHYIQSVKSLFQQKQALSTGQGLFEYNSPAGVDNIVYVPTREGRGAITFQEHGGDYAPGGLQDVDLFLSELFGGLGVPKQYFGFTGDSAGFDGGGAIARTSVRYAKNIQLGQSRLISLITKLINIHLVDNKRANLIGKFQLKMVAPATVETADMAEEKQRNISVVDSIVNLLDGTNDSARLRVVYNLMGNITQNREVRSILMEEIERLEKKEKEEVTEEAIDELDDVDSPIDFGTDSDFGDGLVDELDLDLEEPAGDLPSGSDLGIDLTNMAGE